MNDHSSVGFCRVTEPDLMLASAHTCCCGGVVPMVGPAAPPPSGPQLSSSQSSYPVLMNVGFTRFSSSKIPNVNIVETTQEDPKDLTHVSPPPQLRAKESLCIGTAIPVVGVDLHHRVLSAGSSLLSALCSGC